MHYVPPSYVTFSTTILPYIFCRRFTSTTTLNTAMTTPINSTATMAPPIAPPTTATSEGVLGDSEGCPRDVLDGDGDIKLEGGKLDTLMNGGTTDDGVTITLESGSV